MTQVPILELGADGKVRDTVMVPVHELDSVVGELDDDYDFGLGAMEVSGIEEAKAVRQINRELGKLSVSARFQAPQFSASVSTGRYKKVQAAKKPTKHAPARKAVKEVQAQGHKPVMIARQKKDRANSQAPSLSQIYKMLKAQGKIIDLLATKRAVTSESNKLMAQDAFRDSVQTALKKIDRQCTGSPNGNYFARWNKLKKATGVAVNQT